MDSVSSVALGEMSHARDLLSVLLSATAQTPAGLDVAALTAKPAAVTTAPAHPTLPSGILTASQITPQEPILSVRAFNAQLRTGSKDDALRKASDVLRVAAEGVERSATRVENYWADALRLRRANWGLITAPLPLGAPTGKGADKTSKDFFVSYGLEQCMSCLFLRRLFGRSPIWIFSFYLLISTRAIPTESHSSYGVLYKSFSRRLFLSISPPRSNASPC